MMLDPLNKNNLIICQHNARRVILLKDYASHRGKNLSDLESQGFVQVLADRYDGKRLNSPNDLSHDDAG
jgi:sugar lactone lactonase YvrE